MIHDSCRLATPGTVAWRSLAPGVFGLVLILGGCASDSGVPVAPGTAPASPPVAAPAAGEGVFAGTAAQTDRPDRRNGLGKPVLTATAGDGEITLSWTPPDDEGITGYQFRYGKMGRDGGKLGRWTDVFGFQNARRHTLTGLDNGSEYRFRLRAKGIHGAGPLSDRVTATPSGSGASSGTQPDPAGEEEEGAPMSGTCTAGLVMRSGDSCTYAATSEKLVKLVITADNSVRFLFLKAGTELNLNGARFDGRSPTLQVIKQEDGSWLVVRVRS